MANTHPLAILRANRRVWVIGAIHGEVEQLRQIHAEIAREAKFGDRLVYTGNMIGYGAKTAQTIKEILKFRSWFLSIWPYMDLEDVVYLRGRQEEMLWKMTQMHFAPNPWEIIKYVYHSGLSPVLENYGFTREMFDAAAEEDVNALVAVTGRLTQAIRNHPGHDPLFASLKQAAYSEDGLLLCVSSGLNRKESLQKQKDAFWWGGEDFAQIGAYGSYCRLVRGLDPIHQGYQETPFTVSLDPGQKENFQIQAICLDRQGEVVTHLTASC